MPELKDALAIAGTVPVAYFGGAANNTEVEADGTLVSNGDATTYDDQQVNLLAVSLHPTNTPTYTPYKGGVVIQFDGGATQTIYFISQLSHRRKANSHIDFHAHQVQTDIGTGNVRWIFTHSWASLGEAFPAESTVNYLSACDGIVDIHNFRDFGELDGTGKGISSILICSLTRDGSHVDDTYTGDILLAGLDFHIEIDMLGSRQELVK